MRRIAGLFRDLPRTCARTCPRTCPARAARHALQFTGWPSAVALYLCRRPFSPCSLRPGLHLLLSPSRAASFFSITNRLVLLHLEPHVFSFLRGAVARGSSPVLRCADPARGGRSAGRRTFSPVALARRDNRACETRAVPRDRDGASRRSDRGDFRPRTHAAPSPTVPAGCAPRLARCRAARPGGRGPEPPAACGSRRSGGTPLPAPPARRLRRRPS